MARTIQDQNLLLWEAYAITGDFGFPDRARMVFQCLTDPDRRARMVEREGDTSDVAGEIATMSDAELLEIFEGAREVP